MPLIKPPAYWREQAEDLRAQARAVHDPATKRELLDIAAHYDALALRSEAQSAVQPEEN